MLASLLVPLALNFVDEEDLSIFAFCISEAHPCNRTALAGIAEVDVITMAPRLNRRDGKGDFSFVLQAFGGITETGGVNFPLTVLSSQVSRVILVNIVRIYAIIVNETVFYVIRIPEIISISFHHRIHQIVVQLFGIRILSDEVVSLRGFFEFVNLRLQILYALPVRNRFAGITLRRLFQVYILAVRLFFNLDLVFVNVVQDLLLRDALLVLPLQPVGETEPLVLAGFQTTVLLDHLQPLLRRSLVLADALHGPLGVRDEDLLMVVGYTEVQTPTIFLRVSIVPGFRRNLVYRITQYQPAATFREFTGIFGQILPGRQIIQFLCCLVRLFILTRCCILLRYLAHPDIFLRRVWDKLSIRQAEAVEDFQLRCIARKHIAKALCVAHVVREPDLHGFAVISVRICHIRTLGGVRSIHAGLNLRVLIRYAFYYFRFHMPRAITNWVPVTICHAEAGRLGFWKNVA